MSPHVFYFVAILAWFAAGSVMAQTTSRGPGKGPATPGTGSRSTYPMPQKTKVAVENYIPAIQIPDFPERFRWKLVAKNFKAESTSKKIPVYAFNESSGKRTIVGDTTEGEEITLEEVRVASKRNYFRFKGSVNQSVTSSSKSDPEFWVDGMYIEFAGKK